MKGSISFKEYYSKVLGCYNGKNIGGTLGAPLEGKRGVFDVTYYTQEIKEGEPLPNDDLDLQLVWLNAVESYGKHVDSKILGEYWLSYIVPDWSEYGMGKVNLKSGFLPPLSGYVNNPYRDSCGCFILSELWACLAPGDPATAVKYAYQDGSVNHSNEGVYAEVFCAAVESAAFAESDTYKLIEIGLSYIPEDCGVANAVRSVIDSFQSGVDFKAARKKLLQIEPGSFCSLATPIWEIPEDEPLGKLGYDAPSNIGIIIIGWLYGENDFSNSICIATNCGEDTDCTAGTLGAILGIIKGNEALEEKWTKPLGGNIKTICIDRTKFYNFSIPNTTEELTQRLLIQMPAFVSKNCDLLKNEIRYDTDTFLCKETYLSPWSIIKPVEDLKNSFFTVSYENVLFKTFLDYQKEPFITSNSPFTVTVSFENKVAFAQQLCIKWIGTSGAKISPCKELYLSMDQIYTVKKSKTEFQIIFEEITSGKLELLMEISSAGHCTKQFVPVTLWIK